MNKNFKILKHLFFIFVIIVSFSFLTLNLFQMLQAQGIKKEFTNINFNDQYNIYNEYKIELTFLIITWLGSLSLFMYHVNKLCYWGYTENEKTRN